jgi:hypothetical protein
VHKRKPLGRADAFDLLHQGKARLESPVHHLLILPFIGVKADERVEQALLRFAQTTDREFAVEDGEGRLIGTLALLDLVLAGGSGRPAIGAGVGPSLLMHAFFRCNDTGLILKRI